MKRAIMVVLLSLAIAESIQRTSGHSHFRFTKKTLKHKKAKKLIAQDKKKENVFDRIKDSLRKQLKGKPMPASTFYGIHPAGVNFDVKKQDTEADRRLFESISRLKGGKEKRDIFGDKKKRKRSESSLILENNRRVLRIRNGDRSGKQLRKALV